MAEKSSASSDVLWKLEEQLTCPICLDHYINPKTLPCFHPFCHQCLEGLPLDLQGKKHFLSCPTCRTPTELPEAGVVGFPVAFLINNLTEVYSLLQKVSGDQHVSCDNCKKSDATGYCKQCSKFYCAKCLSVHNDWVTFVDHTVISLDEVIRTAFKMPSSKPDATMKCSSHKKPLEIYCETCHDLICHDCTVRIHKGHDYDLVSDTYDKHRQIIEYSLDPVKEQIALVTEAVTILTQREKEITRQGETVKEEIRMIIKQIVDLLLQSEKKLTKDVDLAIKNKLSVLSQQKQNAETTLGQLTDCFDFIEESLKMSTPQQVLLAKPQMIDRTNRVIKSFKPESFQPLEQADIKLVKSEKIEDIHKSIGDVRCSLSRINEGTKGEQKLEKQGRLEMEKKMCKFKLFGNHPVNGKLIEKKIEVNEDTPLPVALKMCCEVLEFSSLVPVERCRLVKYDDYSETLDQSLDLDEFGDQTFGQVVGGARSYYSFDLFVETRTEEETFKKYNKGGMKLKIHVVDLETGEVKDPIPIRAEHTWTIEELKVVIGDIFNMEAKHMNLVLEVYNDVRHMHNNEVTLRGEGLYRKHSLFASSDPLDSQKPYNESKMCEVVDEYVNSILLSIKLPPREIQMKVDRRTTLAQLKEKVAPLVGVESLQFKMYRVYSNQQEYEMERLTDTLLSTPSESKLVVRLGRALQPGEHRVKLYLLRVNEGKFFNLMMESIVAKNTSIKDFKKQIVEEAKKQGVECELRSDRLRLRKKIQRTPGTVYLDYQLINKDIYIYGGSEMFVEPLEDEEIMKVPTQMQVYIRRWRPSEYIFDPMKEVILDSDSPDDLKKKISKVSGIAFKNISIAKGTGSFPSDMSALDVESDLKWDPPIRTISQSPFSLYDDGGVIYYKDSTEKLAKLSTERRNKLEKSKKSANKGNIV